MSAQPPRLTAADRALVRARSAWGRAPADRFWSHFREDWREQLRLARAEISSCDGSADASREIVTQEHADEARPHLQAVHRSWWTRALQDESPAVQRAVVANLEAEDREFLQDSLGLADADLETDRPAHAGALQTALALWTERMVGGPRNREDDSAAIVALTRLDRHAFYRLVTVVGLVKLACSRLDQPDIDPAQPDPDGLRVRDRVRVTHFREAWGQPERRLIGLARRDRELARASENVHARARAGQHDDDPPAHGGHETKEHEASHARPARPADDGDREAIFRLGLATIGRLLLLAEPHRVRWALQHVPYNVAKYTRLRMSANVPGISGPSLVAWESRVLRLACDRLRAEGRLDEEWEKLA